MQFCVVYVAEEMCSLMAPGRNDSLYRSFRHHHIRQLDESVAEAALEIVQCFVKRLGGIVQNWQ